MQGIRRPKLLFQSTSILQQSLRYYRAPRTFRPDAKMENFFFKKPLYRPVQPSPLDMLFRRGYANAARDTFAAYASSRQVMWTIIGLNTAVFGAWQYAIAQRDQNLVNKLSKNFSISLQGIRERRYWTLLTSAFSHQMLPHFFFNMFTFHTFSTILAFMGVGGLQFSTLCLGSAIAGSLGFIAQWQSQSPGSSLRSGLGASGMVMGAGAAATCLAPFAPMQLFFIPVTIPLWVITIGYAAIDTYYLHSNSPVGHSAHLGGSAFGVAFYFIFLRRFGGVWRTLGNRKWR